MGDITANDGDSQDFDVQLTNVAERENKASRARGFQQFPQAVHKPGGLQKEAKNAAELEALLAKGWYADIRDVPVDERDDEDLPNTVSQLTVDQAAKVIARATPKELADMEADEQSHGNREAVIALIDKAKDAVGATPAKAAKAEKPPKADKPPKAAKAKE